MEYNERKNKIILASQSPRRRELLSRLVSDFEVAVPLADESLQSDISPEDAVKYLARIKAESIAGHYSGIIIGADTLVVLNGEFLGKPRDVEQACLMLKKLSGNIHKVYTGVCIIDTDTNTTICDYECTDVHFDILSEQDIEWYISTDEPIDKAGSYAVQGLGGRFIKKINGCYYNVVGLPINMLSKMLKKIDFGG